MNKYFLVLTLTGFLLSGCSSNKDYLPAEFFGLKLTNVKVDDEAANFVNKLHLKTVSSSKNKIGFYEGKTGRAVIYLSMYDEANPAISAAKKMIAKLKNDKTPFVDGEFIIINDEAVYICFGMGQTHFIFVRDDILFWVSVDNYFAKRFLADYLDYIS
ncbi:MAG: hypothetical protein K8H86_15310 [Ignavibacteriaceae bacterium]|nr:hypothetical protein [Ignavibacteriaceae bacterium]